MNKIPGFDVSLAVNTAQEWPLSRGPDFLFRIVGGETAAVYESGTIELLSCVDRETAFDPFDEVFEGGTVEGAAPRSPLLDI